MYVLHNDINEVLVIIDKDDEQLDDCWENNWKENVDLNFRKY